MRRRVEAIAVGVLAVALLAGLGLLAAADIATALETVGRWLR